MTQPVQPQPGQEPAPQQPEAKPPWGDDFDAEKAWKLVQNLRDDNSKLKDRPVLDDVTKSKLAEYDKLVESQKSEAQKQAEEAARWQSDAERWRSAAVSSTVKALAATDFADPDDAVRNLDPTTYLGADGAIDEKRIASDLAALLDAKPHYRRASDAGAPGLPRTPRPNPAQGSGGGKPALDPAQEFASVLTQALHR